MNDDGPRVAARGRGIRLALRATAAVLLLLLAAALVGPRRLAEQLRIVDLPWFVSAVVVAIAANFVSAWRWTQIARALGCRAPLAPLVTAYAQGVTVNILLPGATLGGDAWRSARLARLGNALAPSALSVFLDRASGLWVLCAMSLAALAGIVLLAPSRADAPATAAWVELTRTVGAWPMTLYLAALAVAVAAPFLPWRTPHRPVRGELHGWPRVAAALADAHALVLSRRAALARSIAPSVGVQVLSAATLWLCARAAGGDIGYAAVLALAAPIFIAASLPLSLGGFGPREFAAALAFPMLGSPAEAGVAAAVLYGLTGVAQGVLAAPLFAVDHRRN